MYNYPEAAEKIKKSLYNNDLISIEEIDKQITKSINRLRTKIDEEPLQFFKDYDDIWEKIKQFAFTELLKEIEEDPVDFFRDEYELWKKLNQIISDKEQQ